MAPLVHFGHSESFLVFDLDPNHLIHITRGKKASNM